MNKNIKTALGALSLILIIEGLYTNGSLGTVLICIGAFLNGLLVMLE